LLKEYNVGVKRREKMSSKGSSIQSSERLGKNREDGKLGRL